MSKFEMLQQMLHNPYVFNLKKYIFGMLQERYSKHEEVLTRSLSSLITKEDTEAFAHLAADLYEAGFTRCLEQHKEKLAEIGVDFLVVPEPEEKTGDPIFSPQEKSG